MVDGRMIGGVAVVLAMASAMAWPSLTMAAPPQSLEITGFSGHIGEWELSATISTTGVAREFSGPAKLKHVGWCSQDGPEEKTAELKLTQSRWTSAIDVRLQLDGVACTFSARLTDAYSGQLVCPDRKPVPLVMWVR